jgi:hypothetical protein
MKERNLPTQRAVRAIALLADGDGLDCVREKIPAYAGRSDASIWATLERVAKREGLKSPRKPSGKKNLPTQRAIRALEIVAARWEGLSSPQLQELALDCVREKIPAYAGRSDASIWATLERVAQQEGLEAPRKPSMKKAPRRAVQRDHSRKEAAYSLRWEGRSWDEIAQLLGLPKGAKSKNLARKWADRWAKMRGLEKAPQKIYAHARAEEAYNLLLEGKSKEEVAALTPLAVASVVKAADEHARRNGVALVPKQQARDLSAVLAFARGGREEAEVAEKFGYPTVRKLRGSLVPHCRANGLEYPWPLVNRGTRVQGRNAKAFWLNQNGLDWKEIASQLQYSCSTSAQTSAMKWARRNQMV